MTFIANPFVLFGGDDADALAFITATGITDTTQKDAIKTLVAAIKSAGIWTKMYAIYPLVGGAIGSHKYNLKDPRDLNAAYRLTASGSITHDANGVTGGGGYLDTNLNGSTVLSKTNMSFGFYCRTNSDELFSDMGTSSGGGHCEFLTRFSNTTYLDMPTETDRITIANSNSSGLFCGTLGASSRSIYRNGSSIKDQASAAGTDFENATICLLTGEGRTSSRNLAFGFIGQYLTSGEVSAYYTAVQAYQTSLSRQV